MERGKSSKARKKKPTKTRKKPEKKKNHSQREKMTYNLMCSGRGCEERSRKLSLNCSTKKKKGPPANHRKRKLGQSEGRFEFTSPGWACCDYKKKEVPQKILKLGKGFVG